MIQKNRSPFVQLHCRIEGSDTETQEDVIAIKNLMRKRDQMCSDFTLGAGINPEYLGEWKAILQSLSENSNPSLAHINELRRRAKEALKGAAKLY